MSKYILLKTDGKTEIKELQDSLNLGTMYSWIGCWSIDFTESIAGEKIGYNVILILDDEFLIKSAKPQANENDSLFYGYGKKTNKCICGNVIVANDVDGETASFTDEEIKKRELLIDTYRGYALFTDFKVQNPRLPFI